MRDVCAENDSLAANAAFCHGGDPPFDSMNCMNKSLIVDIIPYYDVKSNSFSKLFRAYDLFFLREVVNASILSSALDM